MQTYLEIKLPVRTHAKWMTELRKALWDVPVRWQNGFYHITLAFLNDVPSSADVLSIIDRHLLGMEFPSLTFDRLDTFSTSQSGLHIVYLTVSDIPERFARWVEDLRRDLADAGCVMESDFRLHVTLGRVAASLIGLDELKAKIGGVSVPPFRLPIRCLDYREFRGESVRIWNI